ncbi:hypothetical protein BUALT_Bualt05G0043300 [Buddleja alternifolia]|uniref:Uncharacterized protein n=1 Tax=Buddleja alternifolia TaxID=168488 RepID=A0AAV6XSM0_9LAMI|nr:hypothetical protein BUALT_Bualt05G0043300 [Buddleja alternifolia]
MGNCSLKAVADGEDGTEEAGGQSTMNGKRPVEVRPRPGNGVWKVKLVIDPRELEKILSEGANTDALIEQMRIAAYSTPKRGKSSSGVNGNHLSHMCTYK